MAEIEVDAALREDAERLVVLALEEDVGAGDVTSAVCVPSEARAEAFVVARQEGVVAGLWLAEMVYDMLEAGVAVERRAADGDRMAPGATLARVAGPVAGILTGERTMLNFVQRLSGVATLTRRFVDAVAGTGAVICDTRKTTPGWRRLEKYAVRCGGGTNHRMGLYDEVLIKDNHIALAGRPLAEVVTEARRRVGRHMRIEVEVDSLDQLREVLPLPVDYILLDNMTPEVMGEAVAMRDAARPRAGGATRPLLEASGGVRLERVAEIARAGIDRISVGALTHSAPAVDVALDIRLG